ncbi:type II toxin-antitoxin system VapC family toxin [Mycobacterium lacus]|uniref:Ribonuclease VapC n=1 Tax=Mycobacterium lacus TaxID=169765 RepID=A0A1X1XSV4_9MYCO|nr:type II toxin-antitoxin system VapC family toxin [Mycobacterium lacus]MCV7125144.1 type II toxin-antitoxin system VapC family toxin [Mycobacterium lacus]ORW01935.1 ribonuclease [Mycobacterium lacus]BBX99480.1 ribonuclease VapC37 [Mycobacterium lacus]
MRLLDLNILIYAIDESSPRHEPARAWLDDTLSGSGTVAFAWHVLVGFVRLSTRAAVFERPLKVDEAFDVVDGWLAQPCVTVVHPTDRHTVVLRELLTPLGAAGNLTSDAHLAALSVEHGAELCSTDVDFSRFSGVRWIDPLQP